MTATFWLFDMKTLAKMRRKRQHVGRIRSDACYTLALSHINEQFFFAIQSVSYSKNAVHTFAQ